VHIKENMMKFALISFVLAGAGGLVVHANANNNGSVFIERKDPKSFEIDATKLDRGLDTFISPPHKQCDVSFDDKAFNDIIKNCINSERKWFKAI